MVGTRKKMQTSIYSHWCEKNIAIVLVVQVIILLMDKVLWFTEDIYIYIYIERKKSGDTIAYYK